jgi:hypothetical protein
MAQVLAVAVGSAAVAVLGSAVAALVGFVFYLFFCAFVIVRTGSTAGLRDVAVAIRAFAAMCHLTPLSRRGTSSRRRGGGG